MSGSILSIRQLAEKYEGQPIHLYSRSGECFRGVVTVTRFRGSHGFPDSISVMLKYTPPVSRLVTGREVVTLYDRGTTCGPVRESDPDCMSLLLGERFGSYTRPAMRALVDGEPSNGREASEAERTVTCHILSEPAYFVMATDSPRFNIEELLAMGLYDRPEWKGEI